MKDAPLGLVQRLVVRRDRRGPEARHDVGFHHDDGGLGAARGEGGGGFEADVAPADDHGCAGLGHGVVERERIRVVPDVVHAREVAAHGRRELERGAPDGDDELLVAEEADVSVVTVLDAASQETTLVPRWTSTPLASYHSWFCRSPPPPTDV